MNNTIVSLISFLLSTILLSYLGLSLGSSLLGAFLIALINALEALIIFPELMSKK